MCEGNFSDVTVRITRVYLLLPGHSLYVCFVCIYRHDNETQHNIVEQLFWMKLSFLRFSGMREHSPNRLYNVRVFKKKYMYAILNILSCFLLYDSF